MFKEIFTYEIKRWLKLPMFYIFFFSVLVVSWFVMCSATGAFDSISTTVADSGVYKNSSLSLQRVIAGIARLALFLLPSIIGAAAYRDFQYNIHPLFFTTRITKPGYLLGRFLGTIVVSLLVFIAIALGMMLATKMPFVDKTLLGPFDLMAYVQPYITYIIPNLLIYGALIFTTGLITRSNLATFITVLIIYLVTGIAGSIASNIDRQTLGALIDPSGATAIGIYTRQWSIAEQNTKLVPIADIILWNKLLWLGVASVVLAWAYRTFRFNQTAPTLRLFNRTTDLSSAASIPSLLVLPRVTQTFTSKQDRAVFFELLKRETKRIITGPSFIVLTLIGMLFMFVGSLVLGQIYGTVTYPVTYKILEIPGGTFSLFGFLVLFVYSGILVNKERELKIDQLLDTLPMPDWVVFCSKLVSLYITSFVMLLVVMVTGMAIQAIHGYYNFELSVYIRSLFGFELINYMLMATLALFVQVLVRNKYISFFILLAYYFFSQFQSLLGIEQPIYRFASDEGYTYSAMNGYGDAVWSYFIYKLYWGGFCIILAAIAHLLWARGVETAFAVRLRAMRHRRNTASMSMLFSGVVLFGTGLGIIRYNTNEAGGYTGRKDIETARINFEKKYKKFDGAPQPRITAVKVNTDIYPEQRSVFLNGTYTLKNKTSVSIDSIHVMYETSASTSEITFGKKATKVLEDSVMGYRIYKLDQPMAPGDSIELTYKMEYKPRGFDSPGGVYYNGTFINSNLLPSIGYNANVELTEDRVREKNGLKPKETMLPQDDPRGLQNTYISNDADWISFEATVSTTADQVAIAPGYLQKEWEKDGRKYFQYKMDSKILNFFSFQSARYEVKRDKWKDVNIEIYYNKGHEYNLDRMITAIKRALDYYSVNFSPYQHRQVRIIEFPRYFQFAQSFPNTIPYSEDIGFIAKVDKNDPEDVDYPFYVTAHEVAHQWWAHQVIGANVQGSTILSETMSQYSALMVMEKEYGRPMMKKFLRHELNTYLTRRVLDKKEKPIIQVTADQQYLHYNKGSLVMYALRNYIGEDSLNAVLRNYIHKVAYKEPPYTTSKEFLGYLKAATPDSLKYFITDQFEKITFYQNKALSATSEKLADGKYKVHLEVESNKTQANEKGLQKPVDFNDYIEIGVLGTDKDGKEKELYLKKHKIKKGKNSIDIIVDEEPKKAGIDIYNMLIEPMLKNTDDNIVKVLPAGAVAKK